MLNFENLDGFVVDLSTEQLCNEVLEDILCEDDKEFKKVIDLGIYSKREYITNYFADTYKYIFYKGNNVYQICEEELNTRETNSSITELQDGYNLIKIYRNDIIEYFVEKVGYANLYYICGTAKEYDVDNNYLKSFIDVAEERMFWGEEDTEMQTLVLRDCENWDTIYHILIFNKPINSIEIDNEINRIKNQFYDEGFDAWTIDDVLEELSKKYEFITNTPEGDVEV